MRDFAQQTQVQDFRFYLTARFLATVAIQMQHVALGWQIYDFTGNPLDLGILGLVQFVPLLLFSLFAGDAADRFEKHRIMVICYVLTFSCAMAFALFDCFEVKSLLAIYGVALILGTSRAFIGPAGQSFVPNMISEAQFPKAVAQNSSVWQVAVITGPSLGGLLYGFTHSAYVVYSSTAVLLLISLVIFLKVHTRSTPKVRTQSFFWELFEGIRFLKNEPRLLGAISLDMFAVLLGGATALLPIYAKDILHVGPTGLGYLRSAPGVGAALMAFSLAKFPIQNHIGKRMFMAVAGFGVFTCFFSLSTHFYFTLWCLFMMGIFDVISVVTRGTLVQLLTPGYMRGRVSAINMVFIGASNELGEFESGVTARWFGTVPAAFIGGIGTIGIALLWAWRFPSLRKLNKI